MAVEPIAEEEVPSFLHPDENRGPWLVQPQLARWPDGRVECVGLDVRWRPHATLRELGVTTEDDPDTTYQPWDDPFSEAPPDFPNAPSPPPVQRLEARVLRGIRLGLFVDRARELQPMLAALGTGLDAWAADALGQERPAPRPVEYDAAVRQRRKRRDDEHFVRVAESYRRARASMVGKVRKAPTAEVAREFVVAVPTAARWVMECRKRGLLPPTDRGRAAG